ncbi:MAG: alginate lyase family protein [Pyrinomonadaceae bacterium]
MSLSSKIRTIFRGDLAIADLPREVVRRRRAAGKRRIERRELENIGRSPARLSPRFASLTEVERLRHFRERDAALFDLDGVAARQRELFPDETATMIVAGDRIVNEQRWELAGLGMLDFNRENCWRSDPLTGTDWGLDYHADVVPYRTGGPDIRVLWELSRFGHAITLARCFAVTDDEVYVEAFFSQVEEWMEQNPYGRGANWHCAMEVALRAINLIAAFDIVRRSEALTEERLQTILRLFDQHGKFILDNDEFSYVATSNHYLSDVVGLFWIGTVVPELEHAAEWKAFGLSEMLREMDKQILPDGADFESSTGYHRFVTEMFLLSYLLARRNGIDVGEKYWLKLRAMLAYLGGITRPDGRMPLIGDADGSQIVPVVKSEADETSYLLGLGAVVLGDPSLLSFGALSPEVLWFCGVKGINTFKSSPQPDQAPASCSFPQAGSYVMRSGGLYLLFNANDCGVNGRGSHAHNDIFSIEVSAFGRPFIVDPGSYGYNLDREARHTFRSTAYHSTVAVDGVEQNSMSVDLPFLLGNEAKPRVLTWETSGAYDRVVAEHDGYARLPQPVRHRRSVEFNKADRYWQIEDWLEGEGEHDVSFGFHLAPGIDLLSSYDDVLCIGDEDGRKILISSEGIEVKPSIEPAFVSRNYGHKEPSKILKWELKVAMPLNVQFILMPTGPADSREARLKLIGRLTDNI